MFIFIDIPINGNLTTAILERVWGGQRERESDAQIQNDISFDLQMTCTVEWYTEYCAVYLYRQIQLV